MKVLLGLTCLCLLASGCNSAPTPAPDTGVEGTVTVGPACPVVRLDDPCPDKPYQASLSILTADGKKVVLTFQTDANGYFRVPLAPGSYILQPASSTKWPIAKPQPFAVQAGQFTQLAVVYDSGIR